MAKLIYDYWFVQFDFPNEKGKPYKSSGGKMVWNEELKREVPEGWEVNDLREILKCNYQSIKKDEKYEFINYLDTSNLTENIVASIQKINLGDEKLPSRAQRIINKNDILYSTVRPNQRHFGIIKNPVHNMIASTGFAQLTSKVKSITNELIYVFLSSETSINRLQQIADSSVSAYPSISPNDILDLKIALPDGNNILSKIGSLLAPLFEKTSNNHKQNQELASLRDWLLPILMNGQVSVGKAEEAVAMVTERGEKSKKKNKGCRSFSMELALGLLLNTIEEELGITYGEVGIQKTVFNTIVFSKNEDLFPEKLEFINYNHGTYSNRLTELLTTNLYLQKKTFKKKEVFVVNAKHKKEYSVAKALPEGKALVDAVKSVVNIYKHAFINKETDKIELLNTVTKLILDLKTDNLNRIYTGMENWPIQQKGFKTKADKFSKEDTEKMLKLIKSKGLLDNLL